MSRIAHNRERWVTVLAGGDSRRRRAVRGTRTLLQQTLDQARLAVRPARCVVSLDRDHLKRRAQLEGYGDVRLSIQPTDAGTGAATLVAAARIARECPEATIAVMPGDLRQDDVPLIDHLREAASWVERHPTGIVVLGVPMRRGEVGGGWLLPRARPDACKGPLPASLFEAPHPVLAAALRQGGAWASTRVAVFSAPTLLALAAALAPQWWQALVEHPWADEQSLADAYATLPALDLSRDLLCRAWGHVYMLPVAEPAKPGRRVLR